MLSSFKSRSAARNRVETHGGQTPVIPSPRKTVTDLGGRSWMAEGAFEWLSLFTPGTWAPPLACSGGSLLLKPQSALARTARRPPKHPRAPPANPCPTLSVTQHIIEPFIDRMRESPQASAQRHRPPDQASLPNRGLPTTILKDGGGVERRLVAMLAPSHLADADCSKGPYGNDRPRTRVAGGGEKTSSRKLSYMYSPTSRILHAP